MKKLIALSLSASMMLAAAVPALAWEGHPFTLPTITNLVSIGGSEVSSRALTGGNTQSVELNGFDFQGFRHDDEDGGAPRVSAGQIIVTGNAASNAYSTILVGQSGCGCDLHGDVSNVIAIDGGNVSSFAGTGHNLQTAEINWAGSSVQQIGTGNASSQGWSVIGVQQ